MKGKGLALAMIMALTNPLGTGYASAQQLPVSAGDRAPVVVGSVYNEPTVTDGTYTPLPPAPPVPQPPVKPAPPPPSSLQPVFPKSIVVLNVGEDKAVTVRKSPDAKSVKVGRVYGSLTGVKVLNYGKTYSLIEVRDYGSSRMIKGYVPTRLFKTITPRQDWGVLVDLAEQKLYVYKNGKEVKSYPVSTGKSKEGWGTPAGVYLIGSRGRIFRLENGVGAWNWVRFNNDYLFHSVIFDKNNRVIKSEEKKLGREASHGCIRMPLKESKWFYANVPRNTPVLIVEKVTPPPPALPPEIRVLVNERLQNYRQRPVQLNGAVYVPLRDLAEGLGATVSWDAAAERVEISRDARHLVFKVNAPLAEIDGVQMPMERPVIMVNDIYMAPVRFLAENMGASVSWDAAKNTVIITYAQ